VLRSERVKRIRRLVGGRVYTWGHVWSLGENQGHQPRLSQTHHPPPHSDPNPNSVPLKETPLTLTLTLTLIGFPNKGEALPDVKQGVDGGADLYPCKPILTPGIPAGMRIVAVSCGVSHCGVVNEAGGLLTWGGGESGQLGLGKLEGESTFVRHPTLVCDVIPKEGSPVDLIRSISCGDYHTLVLTKSGGAWGCGRNEHGQVGSGLTGEHDTLVQVVLPESGLVLTELASGSCHNLARTATGGVLSWGYGEYGQLGHGDCYSVQVPTQVTRLTLILTLTQVPIASLTLGDGPRGSSSFPRGLRRLAFNVCTSIWGSHGHGPRLLGTARRRACLD